MVIYGIWAAVFFWLLILSWALWQIRGYIRKNRILGSGDVKLQKDIEQIRKELNREIEKSKFYLQKIGLVRFNPFERMGGEQSFIVALLDEQNNGITANFIYTRDGLRVYTKKVKAGKGQEYDLSDEEKKAIENCLKK